METRKPDYKNWVPKGMVIGVLAGTAACAVLFILFGICGICVSGMLRTVLAVVLGLGLAGLLVMSALCLMWQSAFSYNGKRQMSRQIIEGVAAYVTLEEGQVGLDVGCGSGALTIACAKRNPRAKMIGLDRWGKEYASFNKPLCESNAEIEGVAERTEFVKGDACKLGFPDETFDAVTSNYVYHNIGGVNRQELLLETLRVLKKGGTFAIHDIMSKGRYGDMEAFRQKLLDMGYERVELIDTTNGMFMSKKEAMLLDLAGSTLLVGRK